MMGKTVKLYTNYTQTDDLKICGYIFWYLR